MYYIGTWTPWLWGMGPWALVSRGFSRSAAVRLQGYVPGAEQGMQKTMQVAVCCVCCGYFLSLSLGPISVAFHVGLPRASKNP